MRSNAPLPNAASFDDDDDDFGSPRVDSFGQPFPVSPVSPTRLEFLPEETYVRPLYVSKKPAFKNAKHIYVYSIDYDGCIAGENNEEFNPNYQCIIDDIAMDLRHDPERVAVLLIGSFRQFIANDIHNMKINENGSCYEVMQEMLQTFVCQYADLKDRIALDQFLLSDICEKKEAGHFFKDAITRIRNGQYQKEQSNPEPPEWHDRYKIALHYAHMHRLTACFPHQNILYFHYDDRPDILLTLHRFYHQRPHYIPQGFEYNLRWYVEGRYHLNDAYLPPAARSSIIGRGYVDFDFPKNIKSNYVKKPVKLLSRGFAGEIIDDSLVKFRRQNFENTITHDSFNPDVLQQMLGDEQLDLYSFFGELIHREGMQSAKSIISALPENFEFIKNRCLGYLLYFAVAQSHDDVESLCELKNRHRYIDDPTTKSPTFYIQNVYFAHIDLLPHFLKVGLNNEEWGALKQIAHPSIEKLFSVLTRCIQMQLHYDVCRLIHMNSTIGSALKNLAKKLMDDCAPKSDASSRSLICNRHVFQANINQLIQINGVSGEFIRDITQLLRVETAKDNSNDNISDDGLRALLFIFCREMARLNKPHARIAVHLVLRTLLDSEEIQRVQCAMNPAEKIKECCDQYAAYQVIVCAKMNEELTDIEPIESYIRLRLSAIELREIDLQSSVQTHMRTRENPVSKLFMLLLTTVREQSTNRQNNNDACRAAFLVLQTLLILNSAHYKNKTHMKKLVTQWLSAINSYNAGASEANAVVLERADSTLWCCCFASTNTRFYEEILDDIVAAPDELPSAARYLSIG